VITIKHDSIFDSTAAVLVCPVNCVGVMGKGLALEFKRRFPTECDDYFRECAQQRLYAGMINVSPPIMFAATKGHWRHPSKAEWVDVILRQIGECAERGYFTSIAIPQLGCGCGGLDWADVWPLYEKHLGGLDCDVEVWIHE